MARTVKAEGDNAAGGLASDLEEVNFLGLKSSVVSPKAERILERASKALVRERIHDKRRLLDANAKHGKNLHLWLSTKLSPSDWEFIDRITMATAESLLTQETERLNKKFDHLQARRPKAPAIDQKRVVVNLTDTEIDDSTRAVLSKGLNFAPAPHKIPIKDIIGGIEQAVRKVSHDVAEKIRNEVSTFLKKAKPPKANLKPSELSALRRLTRNKDITILPADKGNATVIMKTEDYRRKMLDLLDDAAYRILPRDPTESITKRTIEFIKKSNIPEDISRNLRPPAPAPPRMYGLPKIHKDGIPLR
ncbi:uncharacterized protein LOC124171189 [Ischnura elegans]|uniref:uncharacterized protein LOC124171189 n=1 Tax=Ischnura elegans TaxID=197161 RepID=UPI001ED8B2E5|nr:uncharacterized protein LOC124171189 [Ischnura elegans]